MQDNKETIQESELNIKKREEGFAEPSIEMSDITYCSHKAQILNDISLTFYPKDFCLIFGASGAGKTTLLHILLGFLPKYKGSIRILGQAKTRWDKFLRSSIRYVPEDIAWEYGMKVFDYFRMAKSGALSYDVQLQEKMCEKFNIDTSKEMLDMTYRQNKLVQILAAVCANPQILILEEPVRYLEEQTLNAVMCALRIWARTGHTVLISVRNYESVSKYANRYVYLKQGKMVSEGRIKHPDYRHKIVTVEGGDLKYMDGQMDRCIGEKPRGRVYLYKQDMKKLADILKNSGCGDYTVESLTMEQELEEDLIYPENGVK